jgi:hypothetical protein
MGERSVGAITYVPSSPANLTSQSSVNGGGAKYQRVVTIPGPEKRDASEGTPATAVRYFNGSHTAVRRSLAGTSPGLFRYSSTQGASAASFVLPTSQSRNSHS